MWGYIGAGFITLITYIGIVLVVYLNSQKVFPIPYSARDIILITLVTVILIITGVFLDVPSLLLQIVAKIGLVLLYPFILVMLSVTSWQKIHSIVLAMLGMLPENIQNKITKMFRGQKT